jgi:hypothetical protein
VLDKECKIYGEPFKKIRTLVKLRRGWENIINIREIGCEDLWKK